MSQVQIRSIITTALATWATARNIPLPLARENTAFTKPANFGTFLELNIIPADTVTASVSGTRKRYLGEVIINIWTDDGIGTGAAEAIADGLVALFPVFPKTLDPLSIETFPSVKRSLLSDDGYRVTPVCFMYRMEA